MPSVEGARPLLGECANFIVFTAVFSTLFPCRGGFCVKGYGIFATLTVMGQHKPRSRIAQFKPPFLVGVVTSAAFISACGDSDEVNPPQAVCPGETPEPGALCTEHQIGLQCGDPDPCNGDAVICSTAEGAPRWEPDRATCNPPPPLDECPKAPPEQASPCDRYEPDLVCVYDISSCPDSLACSGGKWTKVEVACNPPPPESECPDVDPKVGASCSSYVEGLTCGECETAVRCVNGSWVEDAETCSTPEPPETCPEEESEVACNPPPPTDDAGVDLDAAIDDTETRAPDSGDALLTECPVEPPLPGDSCAGFQVDLTCNAGPDPCDAGAQVRCDGNGEWQGIQIGCSPPTPDTSDVLDGG